MQILEEAEITNAFNNEVHFRDTLIFGTSNDCSAEIDDWVKRHPRADLPLPVDSAEFGEQLREMIDLAKKREAGREEEFQEAVFDAAVRHMSDVFVDRFDIVRGVEPYTDQEVIGIIDLMIRQQGNEIGLTLQPTNSLILHVLRQSYKPKNGLRPVRRAVERMIRKPLGMMMIHEQFVPGQTVSVDIAEGITFRRVESTSGAVAIAEAVDTAADRRRRESRR